LPPGLCLASIWTCTTALGLRDPLYSTISHSLPGHSSFTITRGWSGPLAQLPKLRAPLVSIPKGPSYGPPSSKTPQILSSNALEPEKEVPGPFAPRFKVGRWEVGEEEWREEIRRGLEPSGLVPGYLPNYPAGLVNINFGVHACVHLGTTLLPQTTAAPPSRLSYPTEHGRLYTVVLVDVEDSLLLWMVINIPGSATRDCQVVAEYSPPTPAPGPAHRYLALALLQEGVVNRSGMEPYSSRSCQGGRGGFNLRSLLEERGMEVVAANYFLVEHGPYVEAIHAYCLDRRLASHP